MITMAEFHSKVTAAGLEPVIHTAYHWQISGGEAVVDFWPTKSKFRANRPDSVTKNGNVDSAIKAATGCAEVNQRQPHTKPSCGATEAPVTDRNDTWIRFACAAITGDLAAGNSTAHAVEAGVVVADKMMERMSRK